MADQNTIQLDNETQVGDLENQIDNMAQRNFGRREDPNRSQYYTTSNFEDFNPKPVLDFDFIIQRMENVGELHVAYLDTRKILGVICEFVFKFGVERWGELINGRSTLFVDTFLMYWPKDKMDNFKKWFRFLSAKIASSKSKENSKSKKVPRTANIISRFFKTKNIQSITAALLVKLYEMAGFTCDLPASILEMGSAELNGCYANVWKERLVLPEHLKEMYPCAIFTDQIRKQIGLLKEETLGKLNSMIQTTEAQIQAKKAEQAQLELDLKRYEELAENSRTKLRETRREIDEAELGAMDTKIASFAMTKLFAVSFTDHQVVAIGNIINRENPKGLASNAPKRKKELTETKDVTTPAKKPTVGSEEGGKTLKEVETKSGNNQGMVPPILEASTSSAMATDNPGRSSL